MDQLHEFLADPTNSVTREKLIYHHFYYDLKIAAARAGYALTLYEPDVDRDGYDVVVDDGEHIRFIQLKTVLKSSKTSRWMVQRKLLRINEDLDEFGCNEPYLGLGGAVVLIEMDSLAPEPNFSFYITDHNLLGMLGSLFGYNSRSSKAPMELGKRRQLALSTQKDIQEGERWGKLKIRKSIFLKARNADSLLALLGLYSTNDICPPTQAFETLCSNGYRLDANGTLLSDEVSLRNEAKGVVSDILPLLDEPSLTPHPEL